nr:hypothetical protein [Tanacetum cinerariifolium]
MKLLEDLQIKYKELAEYINSPSWDRPTLFNDNEEHSVQYKEYLDNSSNEIAASNSNHEKEKPPQDFDIRQLVREECCIGVCRKQKQNMEDTMLELVEVCRQKEFYCMHDNEIKNVVEQPTKRGTRIEKSLQNFRVQKSSTSLTNTFQISPVHAITPVLPTKEPEYSLSMGYEHLNTVPKTELDEVKESSAKNLLPIPSEYDVTSDDESECDVPIKDESSLVFPTFSNPLFDCNDDFTSSDDESLSDEDVSTEDFKVYSNPLFDDEEINSNKLDPHCFNAESDFIESLFNHDILIDSSLKFDYLEEFFGEHRIRREHEEYISIMEKLLAINPFPRPLEKFHDNSIIETLPASLIPIEDKGEIYVLEELLVDDSIPFPKNEAFDFDHHDDPSFPRLPPEPQDIEFDFEPNSGEVISIVINNIDELNEDECFDPRGEINVFANVKDDDYFPIIFVIRIFLPYLIYPEVFPLILSAKSENTIFDPGISV